MTEQDMEVWFSISKKIKLLTEEKTFLQKLKIFLQTYVYLKLNKY